MSEFRQCPHGFTPECKYCEIASLRSDLATARESLAAVEAERDDHKAFRERSTERFAGLAKIAADAKNALAAADRARDELAEALRPFAMKVSDWVCGDSILPNMTITVNDLRRAAALISRHDAALRKEKVERFSEFLWRLLDDIEEGREEFEDYREGLERLNALIARHNNKGPAGAIQ
jgi:hypothetical protein